jgi:hypothetical protein
MQVLQIRDAQIIRLVERIGEHYRGNISSRFIRPALLQLPLEKSAWDLLEVLTEKLDQFRYQGFLLDDLYRQIVAAAQFVSLVRRDLVPTLRKRIERTGNPGPDKVLQDMAVNNFNSNLQVFADLVYELYIKLVELDKKNAQGRQPIYAQIPELQDIGVLLVSG